MVYNHHKKNIYIFYSKKKKIKRNENDSKAVKGEFKKAYKVFNV